MSPFHWIWCWTSSVEGPEGTLKGRGALWLFLATVCWVSSMGGKPYDYMVHLELYRHLSRMHRPTATLQPLPWWLLFCNPLSVHTTLLSSLAHTVTLLPTCYNAQGLFPMVLVPWTPLYGHGVLQASCCTRAPVLLRIHVLSPLAVVSLHPSLLLHVCLLPDMAHIHTVCFKPSAASETWFPLHAHMPAIFTFIPPVPFLLSPPSLQRDASWFLTNCRPALGCKNRKTCLSPSRFQKSLKLNLRKEGPLSIFVLPWAFSFSPRAKYRVFLYPTYNSFIIVNNSLY